MNYEQHLDEVTTLIFERFGLSEDASVKLVMRAQADGYFSEHDDDPRSAPSCAQNRTPSVSSSSTPSRPRRRPEACPPRPAALSVRPEGPA
jgi:hypothetical protein